MVSHATIVPSSTVTSLLIVMDESFLHALCDSTKRHRESINLADVHLGEVWVLRMWLNQKNNY